MFFIYFIEIIEYNFEVNMFLILDVLVYFIFEDILIYINILSYFKYLYSIKRLDLC